MADKIDLKAAVPGYRARRGVLDVVELLDARYLMLDGHGDPNTAPGWALAIGALYPLAYRLKFASKRELGIDYVVPPLEGLWWADDLASYSSSRDKSHWDWTLMLLVPDWIDDAFVESVRRTMLADAPVPRLEEVRIEMLAEGRCVQTLHVGPYDEEGPVLAAMHEEFIPSQSLRMTGEHHEIYLTDARRTAPDKLRTILRQPVEPNPGDSVLA